MNSSSSWSSLFLRFSTTSSGWSYCSTFIGDFAFVTTTHFFPFRPALKADLAVAIVRRPILSSAQRSMTPFPTLKQKSSWKPFIQITPRKSSMLCCSVADISIVAVFALISIGFFILPQINFTLSLISSFLSHAGIVYFFCYFSLIIFQVYVMLIDSLDCYKSCFDFLEILIILDSWFLSVHRNDFDYGLVFTHGSLHNHC